MKELIDYIVANETIKQYGEIIKYSVEESRFYVFEERKWIPEDDSNCNHTVEYYIKQVIFSIDPKPDINISPLIKKTKIILASSEPQLKISYKNLNNEPEFLCCNNVMLDLKNNTTFAHTPKCLNTMCTNIDYKEPKIDVFGNPVLPEIFYNFLSNMLDNGNPSITRMRVYAFLRILSMTLFGYDNKRFFIHIYGSPGSGKSILAKLINYITGEYSVWLNYESIAAKKYHNGSAPAPDLLMTFGKRIALIDEVCAKTILSSANLKKSTGGNPEVARNLYSSTYKCFPSLITPILLSNDHLKFDDFDEALMSRLVLIKVGNTIPIQNQRSDFFEELKKHASEIFSALVYFAYSSYKYSSSIAGVVGLNAIYFADDKKEYYINGMSSTAAFFKECIIKDKSNTISTTELHEKYIKYCEDNNIEIIENHIVFINELKKYFPTVKKVRTSDRRQAFRGLSFYDYAKLRAFVDLCYQPNQHIHTDILRRKMAETNSSEDYIYYSIADKMESDYLYSMKSS